MPALLFCPAKHPSELEGVGKTFLTVLKQTFCHQRKLWCHLIVPRALSSTFQKILTCQSHSQDKKENERPFLLSSLKMRIQTIWVYIALKYLGNLSKDGWSRHNYRPRSMEIMYLVASIRPSVSPSVRYHSRGLALPSAAKSNRSHYQFKVYVCNQSAYADNCADAVDRLLIELIW